MVESTVIFKLYFKNSYQNVYTQICYNPYQASLIETDRKPVSSLD